MNKISYKEQTSSQNLDDFSGKIGICQKCRKEKHLIKQTNFCKDCHTEIYSKL